MTWISRTASASAAQLTSNLRSAAIRSAAVRTPQLHARVAPRTFYTGTSVASSSKLPASDEEKQLESPSEGAGEVGEKKKRKRRTKEEIEAARMANQTFGLPIRRNRRTRQALPGAPSHSASQAQEDEAKIAKSARAKRAYKKRGTGKSEGESASESKEDPFTDLEALGELVHQMSYDHLPPRQEWKQAFPNAKAKQTIYRYFVSNRSTVQNIIPKLGIHDPERNGEKVTIVEGYPGPGTFTSELVKIPEVEKVVALEASECYNQKLEVLRAQLEEKQAGGGERLSILKQSAYDWGTYAELVTSGRLAHLTGRVVQSDGRPVDFSTDAFVPPDHADASWQKLSPIIFLAQLPNTVYGEQLFAQIVSAIATRSWLFRHGRIQIGFVCGESLAKRCLAVAGDKTTRGKLGTTVQCLADIEVHQYAHELQPHAGHFFPPTMSVGPRVPHSSASIIPNSNSSTGMTRTGMVMMTITPRKKPLVTANEIEAFEFITRNLFILRTKPIGDALTHVAPGGQNVLKMTSPEQAEKGLISQDEVILPSNIVADLTNVQWANLARMFEKWPFRPQHLFEEGRIKSDKRDN